VKGFDPKFLDLPDFIVSMTKEIWEDRHIDELRHYYTPTIPVRSPDGVVVGNLAVIDATRATLAEFPDRELLGEDVIWSGNEEEGFLSSHRIFSTATHTGDGEFGPATRTRLGYRVIADCAAKDNQIYDEWLVRDKGAIVRQLGIDPRAFAAAQIAAEGGSDSANQPLSAAADVPPVYTGLGNDDEFGTAYADLLNHVFDGGSVDSAIIEGRYDRAVQLELPGGRTAHGWSDAAAFWSGLRTSFPDARFAIHHKIGRDDRGMPGRAAIRWSLTGLHAGAGAFGPPTGANVSVMGISHAEFGPRGLHREFVLFDETAIWKQILLHTG
jgi:hypothetical protein